MKRCSRAKVLSSTFKSLSFLHRCVYILIYLYSHSKNRILNVLNIMQIIYIEMYITTDK